MLKFLCTINIMVFVVLVVPAQQLSIKPVDTTEPLKPQSEEFSWLFVKPTLHTISNFRAFSQQADIHLFTTTANPYQPKQNLPIFCAIEQQLSKLIKRRVKLGVP